MTKAWRLQIVGGGGSVWYFARKPTKLQCEQRMAAECGDSYTLRYVECPEGVCYDALS